MEKDMRKGEEKAIHFDITSFDSKERDRTQTKHIVSH